MLFTTTTELVALALVFIAGWLFGLASHPGGRKWKARYADEREANAVLRREHDTRLADVQRRNTELERENERLGRVAPVTAATIAPHAHASQTHAVENHAAQPHAVPASATYTTTRSDDATVGSRPVNATVTDTTTGSAPGSYPRRVAEIGPDERDPTTGNRR